MDFDLIYEQYFLDVYRFIFSLSRDEKISEDITQETFLKAMNNIKKFKGECDIKFWLFQIAKNTYFTYSKKVKIENDNITLKYQEYEKDGFCERLIVSEDIFEIHKALHKLDDPYKEVFTLRVFGELSFIQIAQLFKKTDNWARVTYYRAKIKIQNNINLEEYSYE